MARGGGGGAGESAGGSVGAHLQREPFLASGPAPRAAHWAGARLKSGWCGAGKQAASRAAWPHLVQGHGRDEKVGLARVDNHLLEGKHARWMPGGLQALEEPAAGWRAQQASPGVAHVGTLGLKWNLPPPTNIAPAAGPALPPPPPPSTPPPPHHVEQVAPCLALGQEAVVGEAHHAVGVVVVAAGSGGGRGGGGAGSMGGSARGAGWGRGAWEGRGGRTPGATQPLPMPPRSTHAEHQLRSPAPRLPAPPPLLVN